MNKRSQRIAELNDTFRQAIGTHNQSGQVFKTPGICELAIADQLEIFKLVRTFNNFTQETDNSFGQHDFGRLTYKDHLIYWKIDYCDLNGEVGSPDPADPEMTRRVMTIMLSHEW